MSSISCRLLYQSASPHLQQLYTGFLMLHRSGFLHVTQQVRPTRTAYPGVAPHLRDAWHAHLDAVIDGKLRLHFDAHDSMEIAGDELQQCDFYFKRSYLPAAVAALPADQRDKVVPLGLYYRVLPDIVDHLAVGRTLSLQGTWRSRLSALRRAFDTRNRTGFEPRLNVMEAPPDTAAIPRVLFMVAAYDPHDDPERSAEKIDDRESINEMRASCIRRLRAELGARFSGGFTRSRFTTRRYPDLVVRDETTAKQSYLASVRSYPVCVATTGLHGSIGGKLAEYVAMSKAIVSERLVYQVPGDFAPQKNYLEFTTPDECVAAASRLLDDGALREALMKNNAAYYHSHLRPDALVRNALETALRQGR